ncbi:glycoside hydrolase family 6 protein [Kineococcus sp. TRM81007]|uniref:glycoside hydrolase family 6 protein n=1 Tax=Kineococcus sp. TRM81007 TaxID=2925831 RepID=UPI001F5A5E49|nr:glycoside hydrolase family 6 protein [Kineococcus sp. TRM81007]MCI2239616.1 glycoside hydrolase family 6 protein [Kineococcus sp. TRM81007]
MLAALAVGALTACSGTAGSTSSAGAATTTADATTAANPLEGMEFHVLPDSPAAVQVAEWTAAGNTADAEQLAVVAEAPVATWFSGQQADPAASAQELTTAAQTAGRVPVIVAYNIPGRDADHYSSGGAADADAYAAWVAEVAAGIGDRPAVVVVEPDAIAQVVSGAATDVDAAERYAALASAVGTFAALPSTAVYLDAGNSDWVSDLDALSGALWASGIDDADGFALNVSNFQTTEDSLAYGEELSAHLDGARFVVDTSRNGAGATSREDDPEAWCNPPTARIGVTPTTATGSDLADAYLWVKEPGTSDGDCRDGAPAAGTWWPQYALVLTSGT